MTADAQRKQIRGQVCVAVFSHDHQPHRSADDVFAPYSSLAPSFQLLETRNEARTETDHQPDEQKRLVGWLHARSLRVKPNIFAEINGQHVTTKGHVPHTAQQSEHILLNEIRRTHEGVIALSARGKPRELQEVSIDHEAIFGRRACDPQLGATGRSLDRVQFNHSEERVTRDAGDHSCFVSIETTAVAVT